MDTSVSAIDKLNVIRQFTLDNYFDCYLPTGNTIIGCIYDLYNIIKDTTLSENAKVNEIVNYKMCDSYGYRLGDNDLSLVYLYIGLFCETYLEKENLDKNYSAHYYELSAEIGNCYGLSRLGNYYLDKKGDYDAAIKCFEKAVIDHCDKPSVYYRVARAYSCKKCYDEAIKYYEIVISHNVTYKSEIYCQIANIYNYKIQNNEFAIKYYGLSIENDPKSEDLGGLHYRIGNVHEKQNDGVNAIFHYKKAIDNGYTNPKKVYYKMASIFEINYKWEQLGECCLLIIDKKYDDTGLPYAALANSYRMRDDYDNAIKCGNIAIEKGFRDAQIYDIMGRAYREKSNYSESLKSYKLSLKGGYLLAVKGIAVVYFCMKEYTKAIKYIRINIELYETGQIDTLDEFLGNLLYSRKEHNLLLRFCLAINDCECVLQLLNTSINCFQENTIPSVINYFEKVENCCDVFLHNFVGNIIRSKVMLLDTHFKYVIKSDGYEQAKSDFINRANTKQK